MTGTDSYSVVLTWLHESDKEDLFEWINNKELVEFNSDFKPVSRENHEAWFERIRKEETTKIFAIRLKEGNKLVGSCQLLHINRKTLSAELQIRLGYFHEMGKGFGTQAVKLLLQYGFLELNLQRIYLHVFSDNQRAYKTYLKVGFVEEGCLRKAALIGEVFKDVRVMGILKEEFLNKVG